MLMWMGEESTDNKGNLDDFWGRIFERRTK
jgi:hypothetical protein